ncbi:MAG TPA: hypothetical protein VFK50_02300 [Sphingomicrobium sp.]|nr:hypothetical protein [Sphingomicrobium sp.]
MTRTLTLLSLAVAAALAGCNNEDHTIVADPAGPDPMANAANADIVLPPAIVASKTYRCKDNSLVSVDWLSDGTARIKAEKAGEGTPVNPADAASPLKGDPQAATVTFNGQSCKS